MFWAFAQGASGSLLKDLEAAKASQQEMDMWKKRTEFAEELQRKAEEAKQKSRIIASGVNLGKGVAYEQTAGGESREFPLSDTALGPMRQQAALLAEEKRLKDQRAAEKFELDKVKAESSAEASRAAAENARSSASARAQRLPSQIEADKARAEASRRSGTPDGEKPPTTAEKRQQAAAAASVSDSILNRSAAIADANLKSLIEEARKEALAETDVVARLQKLREVEALVAANSSTAYNSNNSTY